MHSRVFIKQTAFSHASLFILTLILSWSITTAAYNCNLSHLTIRVMKLDCSFFTSTKIIYALSGPFTVMSHQCPPTISILATLTVFINLSDTEIIPIGINGVVKQVETRAQTYFGIFEQKQFGLYIQIFMHTRPTLLIIDWSIQKVENQV